MSTESSDEADEEATKLSQSLLSSEVKAADSTLFEQPS